jgi:hypothetical protein
VRPLDQPWKRLVAKIAVLVAIYYVLVAEGIVPATQICGKGENGYPGQCSSYDLITALFARGFVFADEHNGFISALAAIAIAAFTAVLWRSTHKLWESSERQFRLANDEFIATHRPRLRFRRISKIQVYGGVRAHAQIDVANIGESEATIVALGVDLFYRRVGEAPRWFSAEPSARSDVLPPGKQANIAVQGAGSLSHFEVAAIESGFGQLCLISIANYRDRQGIVRSVSAFRVYDPKHRRFQRAADDDEFAEWDYED